MNFDQSDKSVEMRLGALEQMLGQLLAEQMAANANGGGAAAGMNVPVMPIIGGNGGMCGNFAYDEGEGKIKAGYVMVGRTPHYVAAFTVSENYTGKISLKVTVGGVGVGVRTEIVAGNWTDATRTISYVPLFEFENGSVKYDYRGAPTIPVWEEIDEDDQ